MKGKVSFTAYCDWIETFEALEDQQAGKLVKHLFRYVNDQDPEPENPLIKAVFAAMKNTLKRDLKKWKAQVKANQENGKKGGRPRKTQEKQNNPMGFSETEPNPKKGVTVTDRVRDKEKEVIIAEKFNFKSFLLKQNADKQLVEDWLKVRKTKKAANTETALKGFLKQVEKSGLGINQVLEECINRSWSGFKAEWLKNEKSILAPQTQERTYKKL